MKNKPILIVPGTPKSIFFEIFFKSLKNRNFKSPIIIISCQNYLNKELKKYSIKKKIRIVDTYDTKIRNLNNKTINLIDIKLKTSKNKKQNLKFTKSYILRSFKTAFRLIKNGFTNKLINGPINKKEFLNKRYLGVTEFIADNFKEKKIGMLIFNKKLSVCPLTTHLPLKLVAKKISKKLIIEKILIINKFYFENFKYKPKIAVTGLNPHCECIHNFNEDEKIVSKAIIESRKKKIKVDGPFPADTIFLKKNRKNYNVILGMYHDQVLTPIKTLFEYDAINITMGLKFLRVTPDHGPNANMVGKNKSSPLSLIRALNFLDQK